MTGVFQDIEFGSRRPELAPDHPRRQRGQTLWREIRRHRQTLRQFGGWEENWGAFRELHFKPVTTAAIRIRFKTINVSADELELFGPDERAKNLALQRHGTTVSGFPEGGN